MSSSKKTKKRAGRNPTKVQIKLQGLLATAQSRINDLEKLNQILNGEASAVLEALWNGHQELTIVVTDVIRRLQIIETKLGIEEKEEEENNEQNKIKTTEETGDGPENISRSESGGAETVYQGQEGKEFTESTGVSAEERGETDTEERGI